MPVSVGKLVDQVNSKILAGGQDAIDTARLVGSVEALESRFSVANLASLPPAADNTGRFIYVEDIEAYRFSDGTQWTNDYDTTLAATSGQLWVWGNNTCGILGDGGLNVSKCSPVREFCSAANWCQVSVGRFHTLAVKSSGQLWAWGMTRCGSLGDGSGYGAYTGAPICSPVQEICSATNWCQASTGHRHSAAVKTSGELWVWGSNGCGKLGDGTTTDRCSPVREFCSATNWCQVSVTYRHAASIKTSGELWVWGFNNQGQTGDGTTTQQCSPVREFCSATDWCQVSASNRTTAAIKTDGTLWGWGCAFFGILGDGTTTNRCSPVQEICSATNWCQVSVTYQHSAAIKTSGELWVWGDGSNGRLGIGLATGTSCSPVREFCSATDWCQVSVGYEHTAAVKTSGELWVWGEANDGRLGDGSAISDKCSPVREFCSATDWCQVSASFKGTAAVKVTKGFNEP